MIKVILAKVMIECAYQYYVLAIAGYCYPCYHRISISITHANVSMCLNNKTNITYITILINLIITILLLHQYINVINVNIYNNNLFKLVCCVCWQKVIACMTP